MLRGPLATLRSPSAPTVRRLALAIAIFTSNIRCAKSARFKSPTMNSTSFVSHDFRFARIRCCS